MIARPAKAPRRAWQGATLRTLEEVVVRLLAYFSVILGMLATSPAGMAQGSPVQISIGSTAAGSSAYAYYAAIANILNRELNGKVQATIVETGATTENLRRITRGQLTMGLITGDSSYKAWKGLGQAAVPHLRTLWIYDFAPQYYIARQDSGVKTLKDLSGKSFNPGFRGSATEATTLALFKEFGIAPDYFRGTLDDTVAAIKDSRIVGYAKGGSPLGLDASTLEINSLTPVRILPFTDEEVAKAKAAFPFVTWTTIDQGVVAGMPAFKTWAAVLVIGTTSTTLSDDVAYDIVKTVFDTKPEQAAAFKSVATQDYAKLIKLSTIPLHAGTVRLLRERGIEIPPDLVPPEAK